MSYQRRSSRWIALGLAACLSLNGIEGWAVGPVFCPVHPAPLFIEQALITPILSAMTRILFGDDDPKAGLCRLFGHSWGERQPAGVGGGSRYHGAEFEDYRLESFLKDEDQTAGQKAPVPAEVPPDPLAAIHAELLKMSALFPAPVPVPLSDLPALARALRDEPRPLTVARLEEIAAYRAVHWRGPEFIVAAVNRLRLELGIDDKKALRRPIATAIELSAEQINLAAQELLNNPSFLILQEGPQRIGLLAFLYKNDWVNNVRQVKLETETFLDAKARLEQIVRNRIEQFYMTLLAAKLPPTTDDLLAALGPGEIDNKDDLVAFAQWLSLHGLPVMSLHDRWKAWTESEVAYLGKDSIESVQQQFSRRGSRLVRMYMFDDGVMPLKRLKHLRKMLNQLKNAASKVPKAEHLEAMKKVARLLGAPVCLLNEGKFPSREAVLKTQASGARKSAKKSSRKATLAVWIGLLIGSLVAPGAQALQVAGNEIPKWRWNIPLPFKKWPWTVKPHYKASKIYPVSLKLMIPIEREFVKDLDPQHMIHIFMNGPLTEPRILDYLSHHERYKRLLRDHLYQIIVQDGREERPMANGEEIPSRGLLLLVHKPAKRSNATPSIPADPFAQPRRQAA